MQKHKDAVARFIIDQVICCPYCHREFSVVAAIRHGLLPAKQMTIYQKIHEKANLHTPTKEVTVNIPRPSYFGSLMQYTKFEPGNEEFIHCPLCQEYIRVPECDFDYAILVSQDKSNSLTRMMRKILPYRSKKHLDMNKD